MDSAVAQRVAAEVRAHLAKQRKTQVELAAALGMSQQALNRRVNGVLPFDLSELSGVADFLGVPITDLISAVAA